MFIIYFVYFKKKSDADLEFLPVSTPFLKKSWHAHISPGLKSDKHATKTIWLAISLMKSDKKLMITHAQESDELNWWMVMMLMMQESSSPRICLLAPTTSLLPWTWQKLISKILLFHLTVEATGTGRSVIITNLVHLWMMIRESFKFGLKNFKELLHW